MSDSEESGDLRDNVGQRFGRLPPTPAEREVKGRASRQEVVDFFDERFAIEPAVFDEFTFWEKGKGKIWIFADDVPTPIRVEGLGMTVLRTRQEHWKPTHSGVQRFGRHATQNVIELSGAQATTFADGEDQELPAWDGDWGYLIAAHDIGGEREPIGVGLYLYDELRSTVPKGNQESLSTL
jgi:NOL1/NOP2/fmu family ribosome biogenesis protein